jgi:hypothetical protein
VAEPPTLINVAALAMLTVADWVTLPPVPVQVIV